MVELPQPPIPALQLIARVRVTLGEPLELGRTLGPTQPRRRIIPISGGELSGPLLSGRVLPGGADWQLVYDDGMAVIDTRYTLQADDGALISIATSGVRDGPPEVLARLARGEPVDPAKYCFRVTIRYETSAPAHAWLNRVVAVAGAVRLADEVVYDAYALR
ncbi:MAG: DUF3237 domain-containing protein [Solirubrobacteraceae bacterium]